MSYSNRTSPLRLLIVQFQPLLPALPKAFNNPLSFPTLQLLSLLTLPRLSTIMPQVAMTADRVARALDDEIVKMMIDCRRAACSTDAPPRMDPVIIPGMEIRPMTDISKRVVREAKEAKKCKRLVKIRKA